MKITKAQLKQIIKEVLNEDEASDQVVIEQVRKVVTLFSDLYSGLPDDESKELFETWLNANVRLYTETWRKERAGGPQKEFGKIEEQNYDLGGNDNPYEKYSADETLDDFWMNELNSALLASMASAGVGNSMMPSKFLEALLPVLQAYGVADEAEEMVNHVRSNQDIYSPGRPALQELKQIIAEEQGAPDYTQHIGNRFQATADNFGERMVLGSDPYEIEVTKGGFKVIGAPAGRESYVGREFSAPGTEGHDERFWTVAMRELGQAAGREGGIYAPPTPEPVIPEVPPAAAPGPTLAGAESDANMGESQDPFRRLYEVALKPYGSILK